VQQLRENVKQAESAIEDYRRQHNLLQGENEPLVAEQISDLNKRVLEASAERALTEANLSQAKRLVTRTNNLASLGPVLQSELIQRLSAEKVDLDRKEAEMGARFGPRHPLMIQLGAEKQRLDENIRLEINKIIGNLDNQVQIARNRERALLKDLSALKEQVATANADAVTLRALEREADANRLLLEKFMSAFVGTNAQEDMRSTPPDVRIVSQASVPAAPAFPKPGFMAALGALGGLLFGVVLAFAIDAMAAGYHSAEEVKSDTGLTVLAHVPEIRKRGSAEPATYVLKRPDSIYAEAIRALHVRLLFAGFGRVPTSIAFVSSEPGEGKTTIALSMARLLAKAGRRVLLVDADLHRSTIVKTLRLDPDRGLAQLITGSAALEDVVQRDPESAADIVVGGGSAGRGSELLTTGALAATLATMERHYDHVLIDSPPLIAVSDAQVLVGAAAATVLIVAWGDTRREVVRYTAEQVKGTAKSISGVVLSRVDLQKSAKYGYGDSARYGVKARKYYAA
jgi:capsular exopolysaccharide synthesis family protein